MKMEELLTQTEDELKVMADKLGREIFKLKNQLKVERKLDKPHLLTEHKRTRARVLTALTQKGKTV